MCSSQIERWPFQGAAICGRAQPHVDVTTAKSLYAELRGVWLEEVRSATLRNNDSQAPAGLPRWILPLEASEQFHAWCLSDAFVPVHAAVCAASRWRGWNRHWIPPLCFLANVSVWGKRGAPALQPGLRVRFHGALSGFRLVERFSQFRHSLPDNSAV